MPENKVLSFLVCLEFISESFNNEVVILTSAESVNCHLILSIFLLFLGVIRDEMLQHKPVFFWNSVGQGGVVALTPRKYMAR